LDFSFFKKPNIFGQQISLSIYLFIL